MQPLKCLSLLCLGAVLVSAEPVQLANPGHQIEQPGAGRPQALAAFESWAKRYAATPGGNSRAPMLAQGLALAKERHAALRELVISDPARALAEAIPDSVRKQIPSQIAAELEVPVSGIGDLSVLCAIPTTGEHEAPVIKRLVRLNGQTYRTFVYGRRLEQTTKYRIPLHGVAIDGFLALHESALSDLESAEAAESAEPVIDLSKDAGVFADAGPARLARMG